jgi:hypothetical protein
VSIQGPGLVRRFNFVDIVVSGNNSMVEGVAITSSCLEGIRVLGSNNEVERNSISRAGLDNSLVGHFAAGIFVSAPGGNNRILNNEVVGAGTYPIISGQGGFGIFVGEPGAPSNNNLIQENNASGIPEREYSSPGLRVLPRVLKAIRFLTTKLWGTSTLATSLTPMLPARTRIKTISAKCLI